jgi:hypothetical protein
MQVFYNKRSIWAQIFSFDDRVVMSLMTIRCQLIMGVLISLIHKLS